MDFSADDIRQLRYRLGWSRAELARRTNSELSTVMAWEAGQLKVHREHLNALHLIRHQAETCAEKVHRRPIAEVIMRDRGLSQIHDFEVLSTLSDASPQISTFTRDRKGNA